MEIMNYFRLFPFCSFVGEDNNACLYNLSTGELIALDMEFARFLHRSENGYPIENQGEQKIAKQLQNKNLGRIYNSKVYSETLQFGVPEDVEKIANSSISVRRLYLEISTDCSLDCKFCNIETTSFRKTGCARWHNQKSSLIAADYEMILLQMSKLNCEEVIFIGADPLQNFEQIKSIIQISRKNSINHFEIVTNGYCIDQEHFRYFEAHGITLHLQVVAWNNGLHITSRADYDEKISLLLKALSNSKVSFDITVLVGNYNQNTYKDDIAQIMTYFESLKPMIGIQYIYPTEKQSAMYSSTMAKDNSIPFTDNLSSNLKLPQYIENKRYHPCFSNSIGISADGNVLPCIMKKDLSLGNLKDEDSLCQLLLSKQYLDLRTLTKDKIDNCNTCAFRYACGDCRAIEHSLYSTSFCANVKGVSTG